MTIEVDSFEMLSTRYRKKWTKKSLSTWERMTEQLPEEMCLIHRWQSGVCRDVLAQNWKEGDAWGKSGSSATGAASALSWMAFRLPLLVIGVYNGARLYRLTVFSSSFLVVSLSASLIVLRRIYFRRPSGMNRFIAGVFPWNGEWTRGARSAMIRWSSYQLVIFILARHSFYYFFIRLGPPTVCV